MHFHWSRVYMYKFLFILNINDNCLVLDLFLKNFTSIALLISKTIILYFLGGILLLSISSQAASPRDREYQIKAAFISNFIKYAHWRNIPANTFSFCTTSERVNTIVELGLDKERWHNKMPSFYVVTPGKESRCQLLFIDREHHQEWQDYLTKKRLKNILMIGEKQGFARHIGHINFFLADNKLRFEINSQRLASDQLNLSSSLLRLARIVHYEGVE